MENNKTQTTEINEYFINYKIDAEKAINHKDIYAFLNQSGKDTSKNLLGILEKYINIDANENLKDKTKSNILKKIVYPLKELSAEKQKEFKQDLIDFIKQRKTEIISNRQKINDYFKDKTIDVETPLYHIDIYTYLHKVDNAHEKLSKILNKELPALLKKDYVINEIVKPLKDMNIEKNVKILLAEDIKLHNKIKVENIKHYFTNREINPETPLWDKDIYAFLVQNKMEGRGLLKDLLKAAADIDLKDGSLEKKYLVDVVKAIKDLGKDAEKEFKTKLAKGVGQNQKLQIKK